MNSTIIDALRKLVADIERENECLEDEKEITKNRFRIRSFKEGIRKIGKLGKEIRSAEDLVGVAGIGEGIRKRVAEIIATGSLHEQPKCVPDSEGEEPFKIQDIIGIGPKLALTLRKEHGIVSAEGLKEAVEKGTVAVPHAVSIGLKYHFGPVFYRGGIPRPEMDQIASAIQQAASVSKVTAMICGSYRRQSPTSNDIDVLVFGSKGLKKIVNHLIQTGFLLDHMTHHLETLSTKYMGLCVSPTDPTVARRIDIRNIPSKSAATAMLYFTGPADFNRRMRQKAKEMGYKLSEYAITQLSTGMRIDVNTEEEVFSLLNEPYIAPKDRV
jgi:DNA polymerase/3'-5' exonuclease PolX